MDREVKEIRVWGSSTEGGTGEPLSVPHEIGSAGSHGRLLLRVLLVSLLNIYSYIYFLMGEACADYSVCV